MKVIHALFLLIAFIPALNFAALSGEFSRICSTLNLPADALDSVKIEYAKNYTELLELSDGMIPEWGVGVALPEKRTIIILYRGESERVQRILYHEMTHIALHIKLDGQNIPRWFDEGVAQYLSGGFEISRQGQLAWAVLWRNIIPLQALEQVNTFNSPKAELAYAEAHDAILYLMEFSELGALCDSIAAADDFATGFHNGSGMTVYEFYREWLRHLARSYVPFVVLGDQRFLWTFIVAFFIIFGTLKFIRQRKKMAKLHKLADEENWQEPIDD